MRISERGAGSRLMGSLALRLVLRRSRRIGGRILDSGDNLVLFRRILLFVFYFRLLVIKLNLYPHLNLQKI
jgi:hypothetical protein